MLFSKHIILNSSGHLLISSVFAKNRMLLFADFEQKSPDVIKMAEISTIFFHNLVPYITLVIVKKFGVSSVHN